MNFVKLKNLNKVFIIAEIGNNHEGNFNLAKKLIYQASRTGADAVKFQTFKTEKFIRKVEKKRFKQLKKFQFSYDQFIRLKKIAHSKKLKFISTPLDIDSCKFLIRHADIIKIASSDNNFFPLIELVLKSRKPVIISTGMINSKDLDYLIKFIKKIKNSYNLKNIALLHCVTSYPVTTKFANLESIRYLKDKYNLTIGYSDHTMGTDACALAVALGANIIEKHFTIKKNFSRFRDHRLSSDPKEMKYLISRIKNVKLLLGSYRKKIQPIEKKFIHTIRRKPYAKKTINKDELLTIDKVEFLRSPSKENFLYLREFIGKKVKKKITKNGIIKKNYLY